MEQENRPKIKKLVKSWKGKLSQNELYYHKIHILFGKSQDAFMNNLEVFFTYCSYFRFFLQCLWKVYFF